VKRKAAEVLDTDDSENVDPGLFSKRSKGADNAFSSKDFIKPATFLIPKAASTGNVTSPPPKVATPRPRSFLQPRSPIAKLNAGIQKSSPLSAPAGRSPTRGKRTGILSSRRRASGPYTRIDPPTLGLGASSSSSAAPFSLDAALKGTIPSYTSRKAHAKSSSSADLIGLHESDSKSSWFFDIHEDTPEQEMTNLLQHSTCVLDISSDEENETRRQRERVEGKENVPPADDISQTSRPRSARHAANADDMIVEKERAPLGEMNVRDYYAEGCDESSIVFVPGDEDEQHPEQQSNNAEVEVAPEPKPEVKIDEAPVAEPVLVDGSKTVEELMQQTEQPTPAAALLQPIEGTGESFEVWESSSAKDETEAPSAQC
jgi:hypothetical protein